MFDECTGYHKKTIYINVKEEAPGAVTLTLGNKRVLYRKITRGGNPSCSSDQLTWPPR